VGNHLDSQAIVGGTMETIGIHKQLIEGKGKPLEFTKCLWRASREPLGFTRICWRGNGSHLNSPKNHGEEMGTT